MTVTNSEVQPGKNRNTGSNNSDNKETSRQRCKIRVSTSTELPGTDRVTPPLVTPLLDNGASIEEALSSIEDCIGEQNEQMSLRISELDKAIHVERENLREEINCNRQEVSRSKKRLEERTNEYLADNLLRMTREAEQRETPLRYYMEKLRVSKSRQLGLSTREKTR